MLEVEKDKIESMITAMSKEEQEIVVQHLPSEMLLDELKKRDTIKNAALGEIASSLLNMTKQ